MSGCHSIAKAVEKQVTYVANLLFSFRGRNDTAGCGVGPQPVEKGRLWGESNESTHWLFRFRLCRRGAGGGRNGRVAAQEGGGREVPLNGGRKNRGRRTKDGRDNVVEGGWRARTVVGTRRRGGDVAPFGRRRRRAWSATSLGAIVARYKAAISIDDAIESTAGGSGGSGGCNGDAGRGGRHGRHPPVAGVIVGGEEPSGNGGSGVMEREQQCGSDDFGGCVACAGGCRGGRRRHDE